MAKVTRDQVIQLYRDVLGRDPYESELAPGGWVDKHARSGYSVDRLRQEFENSDERKQSGGGGGGGGGGVPSAPAQQDPMEAYRKLISDWYKMKPATPGAFKYDAQQETADKNSVQQEYRPFYQEQATQSGEDFSKALASAREGFSRRGLWGAAAGTETRVDPATGLATTNVGVQAPKGGPVSGMRQVGEQNLSSTQQKSNTAFGRAFTESVAGGVQNRKAEAQDIWQRTVRDPYEDAYKGWLAQLNVLQAQQ